MFAVPTLVGVSFGGLIVWTLRVLAANQAYAQQLEEREQEVLDINHDLEARVAARGQELAHTHEKLLRSQKLAAVGHLSSGLAHDVNNLLTIVLANASLLKEELGATDQRRMADHIIDACGKGSDLTRQLLTTARAQALEHHEMQLAEAVDSLVPLLSRSLGPNIRVEVNHETAPLVLAVPSQLDQVLLNLVLNARDAMPEGGVIRLGTGTQTTRGRPGAVLTVQDTGTGIASEAAAHLFEPFFSTKGAGKGTGLGLPTVRGIVQDLGGHIGFDTSPSGTTFEVRVPTATPAAATPTSAHRRSTQRPAVLLVEDEPHLRALFERILSEQPVDLHAVSNAAEAIERARQLERVDLLVTDIELHDGAGDRLWSELALHHPGVAALFTSGSAADAVPGARVLPKPFEAASLVEAVLGAVGGRGVVPPSLPPANPLPPPSP